MKQHIKSFLCAALLLSSVSILNAKSGSCDDCFKIKDDCKSSCDTDCKTDCKTDCNDCTSSSDDCSSCCDTPVRTFINFRSQGANTARELVGWQWELNKPFMCENYGAAYIAYEFQKTFKGERIANALFGGTTLRFSGSQVANRNPKTELLADNFGLSRTFTGEISFCPEIKSNIVDLGYFMGLDCWWQGTYLRFHMPIVQTQWSLREECGDCCNVCPTVSPDQFAPCYVGSGTVDAASSIEEALSGKFLFGDMQTPWCAGRFSFCDRKKTGLADIDVIFGYNFINNDCYHLGVYAQAVLPTGGKPNSLYIFNPFVGNGGHFELGAGLSAHAVLWSCEDQNLAVFLEGNVTHMFKNRQCRLFDLCKNGPFSRYELLKEYDSNGTTNEYNGTLVSATCFTNREVDVRIDVKGDASIKLAYRWCGWGLDLGYNIYGTSQEKIELRCNEDCCDTGRKFAIKGCENVCCFDYQTALNTSTNPQTFQAETGNDTRMMQLQSPNSKCDAAFPAIGVNFRDVIVTPDNAAQPCATAYKCVPNAPVVFDPSDLPCSVCANESITQATPVSQLTVINNVAPAVFLDPVRDINWQSGEARSVLTNKFFAHLNYQWFDECGWNPHIGVGGEVELASKNGRESCNRAYPNFWGVWIKGGVSF